ncbi:MAG: hypothetical protein EA394_08180 [Bacteroidia bacterium]|nr:MAG: hypothetical protein EA394_08180 [Bacteroidia bacterium]
MKKTISTLIFFLFFLISLSFAQVKLIFDTDMGGDADDLGALAMLHNLKDAGECKVLAIMLWSNEKYAVPAVNAVNIFYGNPDIPIGVRDKEAPMDDDWRYNKPLAKALPYELTNQDVPLAVDLYRKTLSQQEDSSVVIVTVGPLKNIKDLLLSHPDEYSELTGQELVEQKVKKFVIMGGKFPEGEWEWNFSGFMEGVSIFVLENLRVPIVFSGYELGYQIRTGPKLQKLGPDHPLYIGYKHFSKHAPWMVEYYEEGKITPNATYDQTAVLFAVRGGLGKYWEKVENGYCIPDETGGNIWKTVDDRPTNHAYLKLIKPPEEMAEIIYAIMLNEM